MAERRTIARPYSKAVFEVALAQNKLEKWGAMLQVAEQIVVSDKIDQELVKPKYSAKQRARLINDIALDQFNEDMQNVVLLLAENKRLPLMPEIRRLYAEYWADKEQILRVKVASAAKLGNRQQTQLQQALKQRFQNEIEMEVIEDPSLIGGARIYIGDQVIDGSLRGQLRRIHEQLTA